MTTIGENWTIAAVIGTGTTIKRQLQKFNDYKNNLNIN